MEKPGSLGFGLGLRPIYYSEIMNDGKGVDWFEIISENYMNAGGQPLSMLEKIRARFPIVMHGVSMSLASTDPLDFEYLQALKRFADRIEPRWISDHLCWTGVHGKNLHDLLPTPYTVEALDHVVERICRVQDFLGRRILVENVSSYVVFQESEMEEWTFIREMAERADCWLLLDVNNIYVSSFNHGYDPHRFIDELAPERILQVHLAGHTDSGTHKVDTHDQAICGDVWGLYEYASSRLGAVSTMIERDGNFPTFSDLIGELDAARSVFARSACSSEDILTCG